MRRPFVAQVKRLGALERDWRHATARQRLYMLVANEAGKGHIKPEDASTIWCKYGALASESELRVFIVCAQAQPSADLSQALRLTNNAIERLVVYKRKADKRRAYLTIARLQQHSPSTLTFGQVLDAVLAISVKRAPRPRPVLNGACRQEELRCSLVSAGY